MRITTQNYKKNEKHPTDLPMLTRPGTEIILKLIKKILTLQNKTQNSLGNRLF